MAVKRNLECCPDCGNVMERDYDRKVNVCLECGEVWDWMFLKLACQGAVVKA